MTDSEQVLQVTARGAELSIEALTKILSALLEHMKQSRTQQRTAPKVKHGKQSMKKLRQQNVELTGVPVEKTEIKQLQKQLNRHKADFHVMKDGPGQYQLYFKSKDSAELEHAFKQVLSERLAEKEQEAPKQEHKTELENPVKQKNAANEKANFNGRRLKDVVADANKEIATRKSVPTKSRGRAATPNRGVGK